MTCHYSQMELRTCKKCGGDFPLDHFFSKIAKSGNLTRAWACRACALDDRRRWITENAERLRVAQRARYATNLEVRSRAQARASVRYYTKTRKLVENKHVHDGPVERVVFNGLTYLRYPTAPQLTRQRYFSCGRSTLHRDTWEFHKGPIPPRHEIHHIDEDHSNNDISNLECLTKAEHDRRHREERSARARSPEQAEILKKARAARRKR